MVQFDAKVCNAKGVERKKDCQFSVPLHSMHGESAAGLCAELDLPRSCFEIFLYEDPIEAGKRSLAINAKIL